MRRLTPQDISRYDRYKLVVLLVLSLVASGVLVASTVITSGG